MYSWKNRMESASFLAIMSQRPTCRGTAPYALRSLVTKVAAVKFDGEDESKENELLAAIIAVVLAGAITFVIWAIFGQG